MVIRNGSQAAGSLRRQSSGNNQPKTTTQKVVIKYKITTEEKTENEIEVKSDNSSVNSSSQPVSNDSVSQPTSSSGNQSSISEETDDSSTNDVGESSDTPSNSDESTPDSGSNDASSDSTGKGVPEDEDGQNHAEDATKTVDEPTQEENPSEQGGQETVPENNNPNGQENPGANQNPNNPNGNNQDADNLNERKDDHDGNNPNGPKNDSDQDKETDKKDNPNNPDNQGDNNQNNQQNNDPNNQHNNNPNNPQNGNNGQQDGLNKPGGDKPQPNANGGPNSNPNGQPNNQPNNQSDSDNLKNRMDNDKATNKTNGQGQEGEDKEGKEDKEDKEDKKDKDGKDGGKEENKDKKNTSAAGKSESEEEDELISAVKKRIKVALIMSIFPLLGFFMFAGIFMAFVPLSTVTGSKGVDSRYDLERNVYVKVDNKEYHMEDFLICSAIKYFPNYGDENVGLTQQEINENNIDEYKETIEKNSYNVSLLSSYFIYARSVLLKNGEYRANLNENDDYKVVIEFSGNLSDAFPDVNKNNSCYGRSTTGNYGVDDYANYYSNAKKSLYLLAYGQTKNTILVPSTFDQERYVFSNYAIYHNIGEGNEDKIKEANNNDYKTEWERYDADASFYDILNRTHHVNEGSSYGFRYLIYNFSNIDGKIFDDSTVIEASKSSELKLAAYYPIGSDSCNGNICAGSPVASAFSSFNLNDSDGIVIQPLNGNSNIIAIKGGTVTNVRSSFGKLSNTANTSSIKEKFRIGSANNIVEITHSDGTKSYYANLDTIESYISLNSTVKAGQRIGTIKANNKLYFAIRDILTNSLINPLSIVSVENPRPTLVQNIVFVEGINNKQTVCLTLKATGFDDNAVAGIMANMEYESDFKTTECGDSNTSYGLCQWHNDRFNELIEFSGETGPFQNFNNDYCNTTHHRFSDISVQLDYMVTYLPKKKSAVFNYLQTNASAEDKGYYWCYYYEVPASRETSCREKRAPAAKNKYLPYVKNNCQ